MPRTVLATRVLPKLSAKTVTRDLIRAERYGGPRLFNGKRLIKTSQSALWRNETLKVQLKRSLASGTDDGIWRKYVSEDVAEFVDDMEAQGTKLLPEEQFAVITDPVKYFSRPQNVPGLLRKQVYFPDFNVHLLNKSPDPYYAHFHTPMWFSKLDLKHYLKEVYNVDVVHVRSQIKFDRVVKDRFTRRRKLATRQKFMVVQLVKPFAWPVKQTEIAPAREKFQSKVWRDVEEAGKRSEYTPDWLHRKKDSANHKALAQQAAELLEGKRRWQPTWESFPQTKRMMYGSRGAPSASPASDLPPP